MSGHTAKDRKKKLTPTQKKKKKKFAEGLKGKSGIKNPFALATFLAKGGKKKKGRK